MIQLFTTFGFIATFFNLNGSLHYALSFTSKPKGCDGRYSTTKDGSLLIARSSKSSSYDNKNNNGSDNREIDDIRRMLDAYWNIDSMGNIPTTAESAAIAAAESIRSALGSIGRIFFVDIQLPQYDITSGSKLYDEVLVTEFGIALANQLSGRFNIVVRDGKTLNTLSRVFSAREGSNVSSVPNTVLQEPMQDNDRTIPIDDQGSLKMSQSSLIEYEDFADFDVMGADEPSYSLTTNIDSFREKLIQSWQSSSSSTDVHDKCSRNYNEENNASPSFIRYRLSSMFGFSKISRGPDMADDVLQAVSLNAQPSDDEDSIMILSAVTQEELIGIRALAAKFHPSKSIILVNCRFPDNIIPKELKDGRTVYSILPLIARPVNRNNVLSTKQAPIVPKVVVLRRYPRDWEIYVDYTDKGFELAETIPAHSVNRKTGPSPDVISHIVKKYLEGR